MYVHTCNFCPQNLLIVLDNYTSCGGINWLSLVTSYSYVFITQMWDLTYSINQSRLEIGFLITYLFHFGEVWCGYNLGWFDELISFGYMASCPNLMKCQIMRWQYLINWSEYIYAVPGLTSNLGFEHNLAHYPCQVSLRWQILVDNDTDFGFQERQHICMA